MEIGKSVLYYDENGKLDRIEFTPSILVKLNSKELVAFAKITGNDEATIATSASAVVAAWFQKTNEIELADRDKWKIETEVINCKRVGDGKYFSAIKRCELIHHFKQIEHEKVT